VELVREKAIGKVGVIQATFSFTMDFDPENRLFKTNWPEGGILDVGCYTASISRLIAGPPWAAVCQSHRIAGYAQLHPEIRHRHLRR